MKSILFEGPRKHHLAEVPTPEIGQDEVLVSVDACGLSDADAARLAPDARSESVPVAREIVGRVAAAGPGVKKLKKGDRVAVFRSQPCGECHFCVRGDEPLCREYRQADIEPAGFPQFVRVPAGHVPGLLRVPAKVNPLHATLIEPLASVLRLVRRLGLGEDDLAVILGLGFTGALLAKVLLAKGISVLCLDTDSQRVRLAQKLGIEQAYTGKDGRMEHLILAQSQNRGADALIATESVPVAQRLACVRDGGAVVLFADPPSPAAALLDFEEMYQRELRILALTLPAPSDREEALRWLRDGLLDASLFARDAVALDKFDEGLRRVLGREVFKAVLLPQRISSEAAQQA